jgi:putative peptide zinc metalloprotease protein
MSATVSVREVTADAPPDSADIVPSALRSDLSVSHQLFEGRAFVIIKDPLSLKYFRLGAEDYSLATLFDGRRTISSIRAEFVRLHPHAGLTQAPSQLHQRIVRFANELLLGGFLEATAAGVRRQMELRRARDIPASPMALFMKALFLKIPLWDPDRLLIRMERRLRWIWSWPGLFVSLAIFIAGAVVFALNIPRIAPSLNDFLTLPNLALVWILTIIVKIIHEFGHGLTCKHYGGEVHEMGALVIILSPFLYADVTDSYLFPKRRHRILVAAAGIYIELVIAAIATLLWAVSQPGPTQQLLFNLMLITSVWTVVFNANPLMKFDGYYILTDLAGVPNLRAKAQMCAADLFRRFLFGRHAPGQTPPSLLPRRGFGWFVTYSLAAQFYLLYVTLNIAGIFHHLLSPYGLAWLGDAMGLAALLGMLFLPVIHFFRRQFQMNAAARSPGSRRAAVIGGGVCAATALALAMPWSITINRPAVLRPMHAQFVRAELPGRIAEISVRSGQSVDKGAIIARLSNDRVTSEVRAAQLRLESARRQHQASLGADSPAAIRQAQSLMSEAETRLSEARRLASRLELRAPLAGIILTADLERLAGGSLRTGEILCEIAPVDPLHLFIPLNERQARHLHAGQRVQFRAAAAPSVTHEGAILQDLKTPPAGELPANLVATLGGDLAAAPDAQNRLVPIETIYAVSVQLPNPTDTLRPGMTGSARLHGDTMPLIKVLWLKLLDFISLDYRL